MVFDLLAQYQTPFTSFGIEVLLVFALCGFVGLERSAMKFKKAEIGIRTFSLIGLLGYFSIIIGGLVDFPILVITLIGLIILLGVAHFENVKKGRSGITTEMSIFLTFFIGSLVALGNYWLATILCVITAGILVSKRFLYHFSESVSEEDLLSTVKFLIVAVVILPLLPNQYIDAFGLFNPANIWFIVVMVSAVSFAGFVSVKVYGEKKGIKLTGLFGGLANSEATVASIAQRSKALKAKLSNVNDFVSASILSNTAMLVRNLLIAFISGGLLIFYDLWWPILILVAVSVLTIIAGTLKKTKIKTYKLDISTPFAIKPALKFALFFLILSVFVTLAKFYLGDAGILLISIVGSLVSSGAVVASISSSVAGGSMSVNTAVTMILVSCIVSSINKLIISKLMGNNKFFRGMLKPVLILTVVGIMLILLKMFVLV